MTIYLVHPFSLVYGTTVSNVLFLVAIESRTFVLDSKFAVGSQGGRTNSKVLNRESWEYLVLQK